MKKFMTITENSPTNDMTNVFSADDEFFIDRRKLESLDSIILEDGDNIVSELNNFTMKWKVLLLVDPMLRTGISNIRLSISYHKICRSV